MASGLEGQRFIFHGYLPIEAGARASAINSIEAQSRRLMQTQIFIEAPYRNRRLFDALIAHCDPETLLCVATHLTMANETISTQSIRRWRSTAPPLVERRPTVFLLFASP
jgi:16S rRNA (cytidine1402-2'-O)-methyltransferase